jgi:DNA-binding NtrC family response regulator
MGLRSGRDHLEHRSAVKRRLAGMQPITRIAVIDDEVFDADVLASVLRLVFDPGIVVRHIRYARDIRKAIIDDRPQLVFLDDRMEAGTRAEKSIELIRRAGCTVRPIIISGMLTRARHIELMRLGVGDVIHKDDIDVARVTVAILKVLDGAPL